MGDSGHALCPPLDGDAFGSFSVAFSDGSRPMAPLGDAGCAIRSKNAASPRIGRRRAVETAMAHLNSLENHVAATRRPITT